MSSTSAGGPYKGENGTIAERDGALLLRRHGLSAFLAFAHGLKMPPERRIPLDAVRDVVSLDWGRRGGVVRLVLGSEVTTDALRDRLASRRRAEEDADAVVFTHRQRPAFEALTARLEEVLTVNRALGVDPSSAEYARGVNNSQWWEQKIESRRKPPTSD